MVFPRPIRYPVGRKHRHIVITTPYNPQDMWISLILPLSKFWVALKLGGNYTCFQQLKQRFLQGEKVLSLSITTRRHIPCVPLGRLVSRRNHRYVDPGSIHAPLSDTTAFSVMDIVRLVLVLFPEREQSSTLLPAASRQTSRQIIGKDQQLLMESKIGAILRWIMIAD